MSIPFYITCLVTSLMVHTITQAGMSIDDFFQNSSYAQLLKEVIVMADTVGLLDNRIDEDERRFVEDSILGKITRIFRLIPHLPSDMDVDKAYLIYWLELAKYGNVPPLIADELSSLARTLNDHFQEPE